MAPEITLWDKTERKATFKRQSNMHLKLTFKKSLKKKLKNIFIVLYFPKMKMN